MSGKGRQYTMGTGCLASWARRQYTTGTVLLAQSVYGTWENHPLTNNTEQPPLCGVATILFADTPAPEHQNTDQSNTSAGANPPRRHCILSPSKFPLHAGRNGDKLIFRYGVRPENRKKSTA